MATAQDKKTTVENRGQSPLYIYTNLHIPGTPPPFFTESLKISGEIWGNIVPKNMAGKFLENRGVIKQ